MGLIEQLNAIASIFNAMLDNGSLDASIELQYLISAVVEIKTLSDKEINWEDVSSSLI